MRIVLDTNVLLSANYARGLCDALMDAIVWSDSHQLVVSEHILAEFREHALRKFRAPAENVDRAVKAIRERAVIVEPAVVPAEACDDADDLPVIGTAVAGEAAVLVTGDMLLQKVGRWQGVEIISPRAMFERMRDA